MSENRKATIYDLSRFMKNHRGGCSDCPLNDGDFKYCCADCLAYGDIDEANKRILKWCDENTKSPNEEAMNIILTFLRDNKDDRFTITEIIKSISNEIATFEEDIANLGVLNIVSELVYNELVKKDVERGIIYFSNGTR